MNGCPVLKIALTVILTGVAMIQSTRSLAAESVKPPMPRYRKEALDAPKLIPVEQVKLYVNGLGGFVNPTDKSATLRGRVPNACVPFLTLQNQEAAAETGAVAFALMGSSKALSCLKENAKKCANIDSKDCSDFEKLSQDAKWGKRWNPIVKLESADPAKNKVVLAKTAVIMNDKSVKLEATADCCSVDVASGTAAPVGDEQPLKKVPVQNIQDAAAALSEQAKQAAAETEARKKARADALATEKDDDKSDDPEARRNAARDPTLARVATETEMELATAKNMLEYYKQYAENIQRASQFQMTMAQQNMQFQMGLLKAQQATPQAAFQNYLPNYSMMPGLGSTNSFMSIPSMAGGMAPTLTMPALGSSALTGVPGR